MVGPSPRTGLTVGWPERAWALLADPQLWASLLTLTLLEVVLGIDNLVFLSIQAGRLPPTRQVQARRLGLALALVLRLALLSAIASIMRLTMPLFELAGHAVSWRDLILVLGGLFLIVKGTQEIRAHIEGGVGGAGKASRTAAGFAVTVLQIGLLDIVFSLDSVITAVGMAGQLWVMMTAVTIAVGVMLAASGPVSGFIDRHPTVRMLALSFLLLIGMTLVADGFGTPVPKGYIYAAIGFSMTVEALNQLVDRRARRRRDTASASKACPAGPEVPPLRSGKS